MGIFPGVRGAWTFLIRVGRLEEIVQDFLMGLGRWVEGIREFSRLGGVGLNTHAVDWARAN